MRKANRQLGEAYTMSDSSRYIEKKAPRINNVGAYVDNKKGRLIRVYTQLDTRLMFEDFYAKLVLDSDSQISLLTEFLCTH
jgi:hypothetical protein